jgi:hypothetical protein
MPLSDDPIKRARQLANLSARPPAPPVGNVRALAHGGYAAVARDRLDAKVRDVFDALAADAPLRDSAGELPAADAAAVHLAAEAMCRLDDVAAHLRDRGILDTKGELRAAVDVERRLRLEAADHLASLGMSPAARARLGVDVAAAARLAVEAQEGAARLAAIAPPDTAEHREAVQEALGRTSPRSEPGPEILAPPGAEVGEPDWVRRVRAAPRSQPDGGSDVR